MSDPMEPKGSDTSLPATDRSPTHGDAPAMLTTTLSTSSTEAKLLPKAERILLPVEIIRVSSSDSTATGSRIFKTVTGRKVRLPAGTYLVQTILPTPDGAGASTFAEQVDLKPGEVRSINLRDAVLEAARALLATAASAVADTAQQVSPALVQTTESVARHIDEIVPGVRRSAQEAAVTTLKALVDGLSDGFVGREAKTEIDHSIAGWVRTEARDVAVAVSGVVTAAAGLSLFSFAKGRDFSWWALEVASEAVLKSTEIFRKQNPNEITSSTIIEPLSPTADNEIDFQASPPAYPSQKPGQLATEEEWVIRVGPRSLIDDPISIGSRTFQAGSSSVKRDGQIFAIEITKDQQIITLDRYIYSALATVPIDLSGPTRVIITLNHDGKLATTSSIAPQKPRISLTFPDSNACTLWAYMTTGAFDEAQQLSRALIDDCSSFDPGNLPVGVPLSILLSSYVLLRANDIPRLERSIEILRPFTGRCSDIRIVEAEQLARHGNHIAAVQSLLAPPLVTFPLLRLGASYAAQRLRLYRRIDEQQESTVEDANQLGLDPSLRLPLKIAQERFSHMMSVIDQDHINLVLLSQISSKENSTQVTASP